MKLIDRIIFIIVGLFLLSLAVGCSLLALNGISIEEIIALLSEIKVNVLGGIILLAVSVILIIVSVKLFFVMPKKDNVMAYTINKTDDGEISVAISAIENTVKYALAGIEEIKDEKISIDVQDDGIEIMRSFLFRQMLRYLNWFEDVKNFLRGYVEEHTGVKVCNIKLIAVEYKAVDTSNERRKIASNRKQLEKINNTNKNKDEYSQSHAKIYVGETYESNEDSVSEGETNIEDVVETDEKTENKEENGN